MEHLLLKTIIVMSLFGLSAIAQEEAEAPDMAALAQHMSPGAQLYMLRGCYSCHGALGEGVAPKHGPRLAGLSAEYIARQLIHFKNDIRGGTFDDVFGRQMKLAVNVLTEAQMQTVAQHAASFKAGPMMETQLVGDVTRGEELYEPCVACHGEGGVGNLELNGTPLAGQLDVYLAQQLRNYQSGIRGAHPDDMYGQQMRATVNTLRSEQDIIDVSLFLATIGGSAVAEPATPEEVVIAFYDRLDERDKTAIYEILDEDVVFHFVEQDTVGPAAYWAFVTQVGLLIPDFDHILDGVEVIDEEGIMVEVKSISITGTLSNGETLTLPGTARYKVVNGKIVEAWVG